jgi:WhiB family transcriptional regulator, redox-sensing transcriptional regulator
VRVAETGTSCGIERRAGIRVNQESGPGQPGQGDEAGEGRSTLDISRLPGPVADLWEWEVGGSCRHADPALFFHPEGERGPRRRNRDAAAKAVCATCPVMRQCREHALAVREPYGVWGGLTEDEREVIYAIDRRRRVRLAV